MAEQNTTTPISKAESKPPANLKSRLKASYDAIAPRYNEWTIPHSITRLHYLDILLSHLPTTTTTTTTTSSSPVSVLELGCGYGIPVTQKLLSHTNFSITANDLSTSQIALARTNLLPDETPTSTRNRLTLLEGDMLTLSFPPSNFSAVVAMYSIIHLPRLEEVTMLQKIASWLKPGGWLLANFGAEELEGSEAEKWLEEEKGWMFWSGWGVEGTLEMVRGMGLEVVLGEVKEDVVDGNEFLWVLARKGQV